MKYKNPVIPGFHPDPSICRKGDDYYLVNSTFEFFPGVPVYHSRDLINWRLIGHCLTRKSQLDLLTACPSGGIYAPTIRYHNGRFYMVTTDVTGRGNFIVHTEDPAGEWSDPVHVDVGGIDPSLTFDDDGKVYLTGTESGIMQFEINPLTGERLSEKCALWNGTGAKCPEGPHLYKINGMYYLLLAEGGTENGHMVTIARSKTPYGPFESCPHNPILTHRHRWSDIQGTGHADLIQTPDGRWFIVFLGFRLTGLYFHHLGRETFLAPVHWTDDGWPVVNCGEAIEFEMPAKGLPGIKDDASDEIANFKNDEWDPTYQGTDHFDSPKPALYWNYIKYPHHENYSLTENPGYLTLYGGDSLSGNGFPTFLGRRQQHFNIHAETVVQFKSENEDDEAGLSVYYSPSRHYDLFIRRKGGKMAVYLRKTVDDMVVVTEGLPIDDAPVTLKVTADSQMYTFEFSQKGAEFTKLGTAYTRFVSTESGPLSFTGVYLGLYAQSSQGGKTPPAKFDYFTYREI